MGAPVSLPGPSMRLALVLLVLVLAAPTLAAKKKKPNKKPGKKPGGALQKGKCTNTFTMNPKASMFNKWTEKIKNCPCWYDLTKSNCACCKEGGQQCGAPKGKYCYDKNKLKDKKTKMPIGCPGVCNNRYTLSTSGFPCFGRKDKAVPGECAWCSKDGFQCAEDKYTGPNSKDGSRCQAGKNQKYCKSVQGDCKHMGKGICSPEATCFSTKLTKYVFWSRCQCKSGYDGNGLQCFDSTTGEMAVSNNVDVQVQLSLNQSTYEYPWEGGEFSLSEQLELLQQQMGTVNNACQAGSCQANLQVTEVNN